jgi:hypothetical protein
MTWLFVLCRAIAKSLSAGFLSALILQPHLPSADQRWEKGAKSLSQAYSPFGSEI